MRLKQFFLFFFTTAIFAGVSSSAFAHGITEEARRRMIEGGDLEYLILGAEHMVTGYDHLLFLFGVMFFLTRFTSILKFVTAFTLGHTITLISATYLGITMNYYLIDTIIALTVIYKGFENLGGFKKYFNRDAPNLLLMVMLFGLIHGFGLSTRLQTLPIDADTGMLMHIISFNAGVELGQIAALLAMWVVLYFWRSTKSFKAFSGFANIMLIVIGALLALMQLHGFLHTVYGEEFPISQDDHSHTHAQMLKESQGQPEYGGALQSKKPLHD
ncbi:MAG: hypothetical protein COB54_00170 [Alphaproteobacteria bacterium]|nr:MAG: hypothetical protein COB54_00170 [Alphaproteobacteria bacterium]